MDFEICDCRVYRAHLETKEKEGFLGKEMRQSIEPLLDELLDPVGVAVWDEEEDV